MPSKCFQCGREYKENDISKMPENCICPKCSRKGLSKFWEILVIIIIILVIALIVFKVVAQTENTTPGGLYLANDSCSGDTCPINTTISSNATANYYSAGYTYQDNLNDSKCWYNLNFCNLGFNISGNMTPTSQDMINILKQMNYQMQGEIVNYTTQIDKISVIKSSNNIEVTILVIAIIIAGLWATYITILYRRSK